MRNNLRTTCATYCALVAGSGSLLASWEFYDASEWLDFTAHMRVTGGATSGDFEELAGHGHDPNRDFTVQGVEVGSNIFLSDHIQGFTTLNVFRSLEDELEAELEEAFVKLVDLPGGLELRGGRFLNRFGTQNQVHLHGWDFVDANLVTSTFLGEEGLASEGAELTWIWEGPVTSAFGLSIGNALEHSHEDEDEHEEEHHDDEEEEEEHGHDHGGEGGFFTGDLLSARWLVRWDANDFHRHEFGLNFATGENGYGRDSRVYSGDYYYTYRANGYESGGRFIKVGGELYYREVEWRDEEEGLVEEGEGNHWGAVVSATAGFADDWEASLRFDWIEGVESGPDPSETVFEIEERRRYSMALTKRFVLAEEVSAHARLQANFDELPEGEEQSVFLQLGFDWGGPEVR